MSQADLGVYACHHAYSGILLKICLVTAVHWRTCVQYGWTALLHSACRGRVDCARLLLDAGADKEATNNVRRLGPPLCVGRWCLSVVLSEQVFCGDSFDK